MKNGKDLLKNIGLLAIGSFGTKILSFLLIPIYTSVLSAAEYGTYDIYSTTVSLTIPILTWNIADAIVRFSLEANYEHIEILSIGIRRLFFSTFIVLAIMGFNCTFHIIPLFEQYAVLFCALYFGETFYSLLCQFARGMDRFRDIMVAGVISSCALFFFNILFLVVLKLGLKGYFIACCISYYVPIFYYFFRLKIWKYIQIRKLNRVLQKDMFRYSRPLVFDTLSWWLINISDRYIVALICGVAVNGIYSVAYKIPSILNIIQNIFNSAWIVSAVKSYGNENVFYKKVYQIYNCGLVMVCTVLILGNKIIANILFANEFYMAWMYAPFLIISVLFGALSGLLGGIFSAAKKSKILAGTTIIGASINLVLNVILILLFGASGAALATLVAYCFVWAVRLNKAKYIVKLDVCLVRDLLSYFILIVQSVFIMLTNVNGIFYIGAYVLFILIVILYLKDMKALCKNISPRLTRLLRKSSSSDGT